MIDRPRVVCVTGHIVAAEASRIHANGVVKPEIEDVTNNRYQ